MKRRSFLQLLGLSPAVAAMPVAAEKIIEKVVEAPKGQEVPLHTSRPVADCGYDCTVTCGYLYPIRGVRK